VPEETNGKGRKRVLGGRVKSDFERALVASPGVDPPTK